MKHRSFSLSLLTVFGLVSTTLAVNAPVQAETQSHIEIVLDASGSMLQAVGNKTKMDIAREVVDKLAKQIASKAGETRMGLRVYGHQSDKSLHNCKDSKLEIPLGTVNPGVYSSKLKGIVPKGYTPIVYSLQQAMKDFPAGQVGSIILVTDGEETCDGNVQQVAQQLKAAGIVVHVVGYQISGKERATIMALYTVTGGQYFDAGDKEGLEVVLNQLASAATGKKGLASDDPEVLYRTALAQYNSANYAGAQKLLQKAVELNPNDARLHDLMGRTYQAMENSSEALNEFTLAVKYAPDNREYLQRQQAAEAEAKNQGIYEAAYVLARKGDYAGGIKGMQDIPSGSGWFAKGQIKIKEWQGMISAQGEQAAQGIYDQANALAKSGKLQEAITLAQSCPQSSKWYAECQQKIGVWRQMLVDVGGKQQYDTAYALAKGGNFGDAIAAMKQVGNDCTCYGEAQQKVLEWSRIVREQQNKSWYEEAVSLAGEEKYSEAIVLCQKIGPDSGYYAQAQAKLKAWRSGGVYTNGLGMKFVSIKPGTFMMGSPESETDRSSNETQHQVTLTRGFYMQTTEVTQGQWQAVMGTTIQSQATLAGSTDFYGVGSNYPMYYVSWDDAQEFIRKLNSKGQGTYRLPTEAEWEYAARAGTTGPFGIGDGYNLDASQANFDGNLPYGNGAKGVYRDKTTPVGSFRPNSWGLYDMHGNVWEWVQDRFGDYSGGSVTDPRGPNSGSGLVGRGGGWIRPAHYARSAARRYYGRGTRDGYFGLRLLRQP